jgi:hypothetical protein
MAYEPMQCDVVTTCQVITPNGLILPIEFGNLPDNVRKAVSDHTLAAPNERAAQIMATLTGCRVTITQTTHATATPEESTNGN